jgi:hypothetical protein
MKDPIGKPKKEKSRGPKAREKIFRGKIKGKARENQGKILKKNP